jgi:3-ketosteroid 9alpha-monooxygenase subunit B
MTETLVAAENVWQAATIESITRETADCRSFQLAFKHRQPALPGQYVMVSASIGGETHVRCYSLSSVAGIDEHPKITVKRKSDGVVSTWFNDRARSNDVIHISRPFGQFVVRPGTRPLLFLTAGSGITPVFAMLRSALVHGQRLMTLLNVNRSPEDVIFASELEDLGRAYPDRLTVEHAFTAVHGHLADSILSRIIAASRDADMYLCGPAGFMESCARVAASLEVDPANIFSERFDVAGDLETLDGPLLRFFRRGSDGVDAPFYSPEGTTLLHTLQQSGARQIGICGGQSSCGTCRVAIAAPWNATLAPPSRAEKRLLQVLPSPIDTHRLACQVRLTRSHTDLVFTHAPITQGNVDD